MKQGQGEGGVMLQSKLTCLKGERVHLLLTNEL